MYNGACYCVQHHLSVREEDEPHNVKIVKSSLFSYQQARDRFAAALSATEVLLDSVFQLPVLALHSTVYS